MGSAGTGWSGGGPKRDANALDASVGCACVVAIGVGVGPGVRDESLLADAVLWWDSSTEEGVGVEGSLTGTEAEAEAENGTGESTNCSGGTRTDAGDVGKNLFCGPEGRAVAEVAGSTVSWRATVTSKSPLASASTRRRMNTS